MRVAACIGQGFERGNGGCAAHPDRCGKHIAKFAFGKLLDGKIGNQCRIFAAQRAAGLFYLLDHLALARFEVGEAFSVGHLGHVEHPLQMVCPPSPISGDMAWFAIPPIGGKFEEAS